MAVGERPAGKYARSPKAKTSLARMATTIYQNSEVPEQDLKTFVRVVVTNVAIGNCDGHARNLALLHSTDGRVRLAPVYDVVPTYHYRSHSRQLAQPINAHLMRPETVTWDHLLAEVDGWKLPRAANALAEAVSSVETALKEVGIPEGTPELEGLVSEFERLKP
jgi:serine/threonine-protein kinase HipA